MELLTCHTTISCQWNSLEELNPRPADHECYPINEC